MQRPPFRWSRAALAAAIAACLLAWVPAPSAHAARRATLAPGEDPGAIEWLRVMQDHSSSRGDLVCSQQGDDEAQTFNNSVVAIAFMVDGERRRAEHILDAYANAMRPDNADTALQNFHVRGQPRGFYQHVSMRTRRDERRDSDRWMGDMAWLLVACRQHEARYGSARYARLTTALRDLLRSWYTPAGDAGYVRHGWRHGDERLHEASGHHEGNIDACAALRMCGDDSLAARIRLWIDRELDGRTDLPLDLYTWRALAFAPDACDLLEIPETDSRWRKTLTVEGVRMNGFYPFPDAEAQNIWVDGMGHMACAWAACGRPDRARYWCEQMERLLLRQTLHGRRTASLPYTVNRSGGYDWVDPGKGFSSCVAWYILARHGCNPFALPERDRSH